MLNIWPFNIRAKRLERLLDICTEEKKKLEFVIDRLRNDLKVEQDRREYGESTQGKLDRRAEKQAEIRRVRESERDRIWRLICGSLTDEQAYVIWGTAFSDIATRHADSGYEEENRRKREEARNGSHLRANREQFRFHNDCADHDARYSQNPAQAMGSILASEPVISDSSSSSSSSCGSD